MVKRKKPPTVSECDFDALTRALDLALASDDDRAQIEQKLERKGWIEAAQSAAYSCQRRVLQLRPWELPPCYGAVSPGHDGHAKAAVLLKRLLDAGLSCYEPDALGALAKIEPPHAA